MANINVLDPAVTETFVVLVQVSEGAKSVTVRLPEVSGQPAASFNPDDFSVQEKAANQAVLGAIVTKAKTRLEAMAAENGNTITWTTP